MTLNVWQTNLLVDFEYKLSEFDFDLKLFGHLLSFFWFGFYEFFDDSLNGLEFLEFFVILKTAVYSIYTVKAVYKKDLYGV